MATGISTQLTRQVGEHLVAAKLGRLGLFATPFAGNVPEFDLVVANHLGRSLLVQVKAINHSSWQFGDAGVFLNIEINGKVQVVKGIRQLNNPDLICIFVLLRENEEDEFYVLTLGELQDLIKTHYVANLEKRDGIRPKNPRSVHCVLSSKELADFKDNWSLVMDRFA